MQHEYYNNEMYHHGVKGQKWGVRRTKEQLGYAVGKVKKAGKKFYNYEKESLGYAAKSVKRAGKKVYDYQKAKAEKKEKEKELRSAGRTKVGAKKVNEMSNEELAKAIERARLEDTYAQLRPQQISTGKKFVNDVVNKTVIPAVTEAGKQTLQAYLTKAGTQAIEKNFKVPPSEMDKLKKEYDKLKLQADIQDLKLGGKTNWENMLKKQTYEKNEAERRAAAKQESGSEKKPEQTSAAKQESGSEKKPEQTESARYSRPGSARAGDGSNPNASTSSDPSTDKYKQTYQSIKKEEARRKYFTNTGNKQSSDGSNPNASTSSDPSTDKYKQTYQSIKNPKDPAKTPEVERFVATADDIIDTRYTVANVNRGKKFVSRYAALEYGTLALPDDEK